MSLSKYLNSLPEIEVPSNLFTKKCSFGYVLQPSPSVGGLKNLSCLIELKKIISFSFYEKRENHTFNFVTSIKVLISSMVSFRASFSASLKWMNEENLLILSFKKILSSFLNQFLQKLTLMLLPPILWPLHNQFLQRFVVDCCHLFSLWPSRINHPQKVWQMLFFPLWLHWLTSLKMNKYIFVFRMRKV